MPDKAITRFPLMFMAMLSLLTALLGGIMRLGWGLPPVLSGLSVLHGPLMVSGFLGTLIGLERAVALGRGWTYIAPLLTGIGAIALITGLNVSAGPLLFTLGSLGLIGIFISIFRLQPALHAVIMGLGALSWFIGNILYLSGSPIFQVVPWWAGFLILTIAGERLELTRMLRPSGTSRILFLFTVLILFFGMVWTGFAFDKGVRIMGWGMILLALWLIRYDIARRTVRQSGLPRFIALCLLSGYVWLAASGVIAFIHAGVAAGPTYDAILHAVFLGFVFVMIFGHAPIIFPVVLGKSIAFHPRFYLHLVLLHITLVLRVTGDLSGWLPGRGWGGVLNVLAIILFFGNTIYSASTCGLKG